MNSIKSSKFKEANMNYTELIFLTGNKGVHVKRVLSENRSNKGNRKGKRYNKGTTTMHSTERQKYIRQRLSELRKRLDFLDLNKSYYYVTFVPESRITNISLIVKNLKRLLKQVFPLISGIYIPEYQMNHYNYIHFHSILTGIENIEINELEMMLKPLGRMQ